MTNRTNCQWMDDLQPDSPIRLQAVSDLRERLEHGLYHYLSRERDDLADRSTAELRQIAQEHAEESLRRVLDSLELFHCTSEFTTWASKVAARAAAMTRPRWRASSARSSPSVSITVVISPVPKPGSICLPISRSFTTSLPRHRGQRRHSSLDYLSPAAFELRPFELTCTPPN